MRRAAWHILAGFGLSCAAFALSFALLGPCLAFAVDDGSVATASPASSSGTAEAAGSGSRLLDILDESVSGLDGAADAEAVAYSGVPALDSVLTSVVDDASSKVVEGLGSKLEGVATSDELQSLVGSGSLMSVSPSGTTGASDGVYLGMTVHMYQDPNQVAPYEFYQVGAVASPDNRVNLNVSFMGSSALDYTSYGESWKFSDAKRGDTFDILCYNSWLGRGYLARCIFTSGSSGVSETYRKTFVCYGREAVIDETDGIRRDVPAEGSSAGAGGSYEAVGVSACPTCGGDGALDVAHAQQGGEVVGYESARCEDCHGTGVVLTLPESGAHPLADQVTSLLNRLGAGLSYGVGEDGHLSGLVDGNSMAYQVDALLSEVEGLREDLSSLSVGDATGTAAQGLSGIERGIAALVVLGVVNAALSAVAIGQRLVPLLLQRGRD